MDDMMHCFEQPMYDDPLNPMPFGGSDTCSQGCDFLAPDAPPPSPFSELPPLSPEPPSPLVDDALVRHLCQTVASLVTQNKKLEERVKALEATVTNQQNISPNNLAFGKAGASSSLPVVAATRVLDPGFAVCKKEFTSSVKSEPTPPPSNSTECRLDVDGLKDEWIADKRLPELTVRVVDLALNKLAPMDGAFHFTLSDANGVNRDDLLHDKQSEPRVLSNGVCHVPGDQLKITKVSSKFGNYFVLRCEMVEEGKHAAGAVQAFSHKIVIKRQEGKVVKHLRPSHGVDKLPNIGRDTAERMKAFKIATVADLAAFPTRSENPSRFSSLMKKVRRERGRMTDSILEGCIEEARRIVSGKPALSPLPSLSPAPSLSPSPSPSPVHKLLPSRHRPSSVSPVAASPASFVGKQEAHAVGGGGGDINDLASPFSLSFASENVENAMKRSLSPVQGPSDVPTPKRARVARFALDQPRLDGIPDPSLGGAAGWTPSWAASVSEAETDLSDGELFN